MPSEQPAPNKGRLIRFVLQNRRVICLSYRKLALVGFLSVLAGLAQAALLLIIVRGATALTAETENISGSVGPFVASNLTTTELLALGFVVLGVLLALEIGTSFAQASLSVEASRRAQHRMLHRYGAADFEAQTALSRGETRQVVMAYPTYAGGIAGYLGTGLSAAVNFAALVGFAIVLSPAAAIVVLLGLAVMLLALRPLLHLTRRLGDRRAMQQRALSGVAAERFELTRELKSVGAEQQADDRILEGVDRIAKTERKIRVVARMSSVTYRLGAFALVLAMLAVIDASNSASLAALTGALLMLLRSLSYGQAAQAAYQSLGETVSYIDQLVEEEQRFAAAAEDLGHEPAPDEFHIGDIEFDHVEFSYNDADLILHDASLTISRGEFVALVGPSGAGKSTLMQLLLRLRSPSAGRIWIDGRPASEVPLAWWRSRVAYVAQEPRLQSGTVADAIRFGRPWISDDVVELAAGRAHIADEIRAWPNGYDTQVGQLGEGVSGGQRQRIAIARALAGGPDLLLLDEPTSALDSRSEELLARSLDELRGEVTLVVIAHRPATVEHADRAINLREGRMTLTDHHQGDAAEGSDLGSALDATVDGQ